MADSLTTRARRLLASQVRALLEPLEGPDVQPPPTAEADARIDEVRHALGAVAVQRHLSHQAREALRQRHAEGTAQVEAALAAGDEAGAREAIAGQLEIEARTQPLDAALADLAHREALLAGHLDALHARRQAHLQALDEALTLPTDTAAAITPHHAAQLRELDELLRQARIDERLAQYRAPRPTEEGP